MNENVRLEVLFHIRDARGLNAKEKAFLFVTESRGVMFSKWDKAAADMGLSKRGYYDARASLLAKDLIREERRFDNTTVYTVNADAFPYGEQHSHSGNDHSRMGNADSRSGETKVTMKDTYEGNQEGNQSADALEAIREDGVVVSHPCLIEGTSLPPLEGLSFFLTETPTVPRLIGSRHAAAPSVYRNEDELRERRRRLGLVV